MKFKNLEKLNEDRNLAGILELIIEKLGEKKTLKALEVECRLLDYDEREFYAMAEILTRITEKNNIKLK